MKNLSVIILLIIVIIVFQSCSGSKNVLENKRVTQHFHPMPSSTKNLDKDWIIILPGYSGLKVFKDTTHYYSAAEFLNQNGFDVIIVEYKKAARKAGKRLKLNFAERVKWATETAIEWGKENNHIQKNTAGHIASWSAGGEGCILLMNDQAALKKYNISSVVMYYPSNRDSTEFTSKIPVLLQTGGLDNVTPVSGIKRTYDHKDNVELIVYPDAHHGFDVASIKDEKYLKLPPLVGKKFIFQYQPAATETSRNNIINFLQKN